MAPNPWHASRARGANGSSHFATFDDFAKAFVAAGASAQSPSSSAHLPPPVRPEARPSAGAVPMPRMGPPGTKEARASAKAAPPGSVQASVFGGNYAAPPPPPPPAPPRSPLAWGSPEEQLADGSWDDEEEPLEALPAPSYATKALHRCRSAKQRHPSQHRRGPRQRCGAAPLAQSPRRWRSGGGAPAREAKASSRAEAAESDEQEERMIVLNCEDIGRTATCCPAYALDGENVEVAWEAVDKAIDYYESRGLSVQAVCRRATVQRVPPPRRLAARLVQCPVIDERSDPDRLFVAQLVQTYDCPFVDNGCCAEMERGGPMEASRSHRVTYLFDMLGSFVPSRTP